MATGDPTRVQAYFRGTRNELLAAFDKSAGVQHAGERGTARESFVEIFLNRSFPKKFVVGSGEIIDGAGAVGPQSDIVVYDETMPILHYGSVNQFLAEGVLAHLELKSSATSTTIEDSLIKTTAVKSLTYNVDPTMHMGDMRQNIASFGFAYECPTSKEALKETVGRYYAANPDRDKMIDGFFVLRQGIAIVKTNSGFAAVEPGEDVLLLAFTRLYEAMWKNWMGYPNFAPYLGNMSFKAFQERRHPFNDCNHSCRIPF